MSVILPFRRPEPAPALTPLQRALDAWQEAEDELAPMAEITAFVEGYRMKPNPLVRAYLAGELARMLEETNDPFELTRRRAFPEAMAPVEMPK